MICKYFHIHSKVFLLFLSLLPHYQAEYLIFRKWPIEGEAPQEEKIQCCYFYSRENSLKQCTLKRFEKKENYKKRIFSKFHSELILNIPGNKEQHFNEVWFPKTVKKNENK